MPVGIMGLCLGVYRSGGRAITGLPADWGTLLEAPAQIALAQGPGGPRLLQVAADPATLTVTATAAPDVLHYWRYADATLKPLPPAPPPLGLARGDAYVAVAPGAVNAADGPAIARFLHLRDNFNAQRLAEALGAHIAELAGDAAVTVLVVEAR